MKNELKVHQAKSVSLVEAYSAQLTEQRDRLETQWKELNRRFQDMKGSEVITKFESLQRSIDTRPPAQYDSPPELPCGPLFQSPDFKGGWMGYVSIIKGVLEIVIQTFTMKIRNTGSSNENH